MKLFSGTNIVNIYGMNIGMVSIAGLLVCAAAIAEDGLAGLVDPTRPVNASVEIVEYLPAGPVLQSTMTAPGMKRAVISGQIYSVGERVGNRVITDIRPYEVILDQAGAETRLRLVPPLAKGTIGSPSGYTKGVNP